MEKIHIVLAELGYPLYLVKQSSLGHTFVDVHEDSTVGRALLADPRFTTKSIPFHGDTIHHIVLK